MKTTILISTLFLLLIGCTTSEDQYITVSGTVVRELTGEGIANEVVYLTMKQHHGVGSTWSYSTDIDSKQVITDTNGHFSVSMKYDSNTYVYVYKPVDDNYTSFESKGFFLNEPIVLKVNKLSKFKIYIKNATPFDSNDFITINFISGLQQSYFTKIENMGIQNTHYPEENLPGGGIIAAYEVPSWRGIDVNSIIYFNVAENATEHKLYWEKEKNGVQARGTTNEIPYQSDQINEYHFDY